MAYTPMMLQYLETKEKYKDCILFYRLGDFYEMFFDDAVVASREIELVLTHKACGDGEQAPMCGVPYHAAESYIAKLIEKGHKVAIAEQMTDPALSKGLVEREVIRIVTPGTVISPSMLSENYNNFLADIYVSAEGIGLCWCDISTGEFSALQIGGEDPFEQLNAQLMRIQPKEIITNVKAEEYPQLYELAERNEIYISDPASEYYLERNCRDNIRRHFGVNNEKAIGLAEEDVPLLFYACGSILAYLKETQKTDLSHMKNLAITQISSSMCLDKSTVRNLELTETLFDHKLNGSLLSVLDRTGTAMGSRKMKQWLKEPLNSCAEIRKRLDAVEYLFNEIFLRNDLRETLKSIYDLERLCARMTLGTANARDMIALKTSLMCLPDIKASLADSPDPLLRDIGTSIDSLSDITSLIEAAIIEDPPFGIRDGGIIKPGYNRELDDIKNASKDSRSWIASLENLEKERTGIKTLKVGFNKVFGYYIEVSNSFKDKVPENYIRKQTLVNGERFITQELKEAESIVLNAQTKINELEYRLFGEIREAVKDKTAVLQKTSSALASLDVLCSFAESSAKLGYVKPEVTDSDEIIIKRGRHHVIEQTIHDGQFVSNDLYINRKDSSMLLITGPNMAGKSTYMRQLALIVLMAQTGCFVPADEAKIGICDRIYTRIGASDNLAMGQSTFFVEMSELAYILNTATEKSLVILDEIGRGTSTYDGLSIAYAVVMNLTASGHRIRTLFATHYHELTDLAESVSGVKNLNVDVAESAGSIVFLHKIVEGSASRSYGIHVAKLAGVPGGVLKCAQSKLDELENGSSEIKKTIKDTSGQEVQMSLFSPQDSVLANMVRNLDIMNITPSQAIGILEELKKAAQ